MTSENARLVSLRSKCYDQLTELKNAEGITYSDLIERFLLLYGSPSSDSDKEFVHRRSTRAWEHIIYRHREAGRHYRVVRQENVMADVFAVNDLTIRAIENALRSEDPVPLNLLSVLKSSKVSTAAPTIMQRLEAEINAKVTKDAAESSIAST